MNDTDNLRERVSALMDGDLQGDDFVHVAGEICARDELLGTWRTYHLVGDVLRSGTPVSCSDSSAFLSVFRQRVASDAIVPAATPVPSVAPVIRHRIEAANEPVFRWKLVAGAASLAAAAAIGWGWVGSAGQGTGAQIAQREVGTAVLVSASPPSSTTATRVMISGNDQPQVMLRDARLDALLEAHQQAGGGSQMPSGFLRNATFEGPAH